MRNIVAVLAYVTVLAGAAGPGLQSAGAVDISPTSPQDAYVAPGIGHIDRASAYGMWGQWNGGVTPITMHTLPALAPGDVLSATLRIPQPDINFTGGDAQYALTILAMHIDAIDDTQANIADGTSVALATIGTYRSPGPYVQDSNRIVTLDVTANVKNDLLNSRATFAWRLEPMAVNGPGPNLSYFPMVENTDAAFPLHGGLLTIEVVPEPSTAALIVLACGVLCRGHRGRRQP